MYSTVRVIQRKLYTKAELFKGTGGLRPVMVELVPNKVPICAQKLEEK